MVVVGRHRAERRLPLQAHQHPERLVVGGGGARSGILRIERKEHQPLAPLRVQPLDHRGGRGIAVAHREIDDHPVAIPLRQPGGDRGGLRSRDGQERALVGLLVPDLGVVGARGERPLAQDDELQQRLPLPGGIVDHPAIRQELAEIAAHRPVVGGVRGPEVGENDADPRRRQTRVIFGRVGGARRGEGCVHAALLIPPFRPAQLPPARSPALRSSVPSASASRVRAEPGRSGFGCSGAGAQPVRKITSKLARTRPSGVPKRAA